MANLTLSVTPTQPSLKGSKIPSGHVLLNSKFHNSALSKSLAEVGINMIYDETMGLIDCYPSNDSVLVIAPTAMLVMEKELQAKVKKMSKFAGKKILLVELTETSQQYFKDFQLSMITSTIQVLPFSCMKDIALLLLQFNRAESISSMKMKTQVPIEDSLLSFVLCFPGVGEKKAIELLKKFKSLSNIVKATSTELAVIVGTSTAKSIMKSLNGD